MGKAKGGVNTLHLLNSLYKVVLLLKELKRNSGEITSIIASIYKIAVLLEELKRDPEELTSIVASVHKIAVLSKEYEKEADTITSSLIFYTEGIIRIFRSKYFPSNNKVIIKNLEDAFSEGQLKSKLWLIQTLKDNNLSSLGCVFSCAGWYGSLAFLLMTDKYFSIRQCFLFEKDPLSVKVSEDLNRCFVKEDWKFKAAVQNILELDYSNACFKTLRANGTAQEMYAVPNTIINTACEHIEDFDLWWSKIPPKKLMILQNNDYFDLPDHINCVSSLEEFKKQADMDFLYEGVLDLGAYRRFLLIGYKKS